MSRTLNLVTSLLARGRNFQRLGRRQEAITTFQRLARLRHLEPMVAQEAQARLAELQIDLKQYSQARRHLVAALGHEPNNARYHYRVAQCMAEDTRFGDLGRAADHYGKSLALDGAQADCLLDYGLALIRLGRTQEGLEALRRAVGVAPDDPEILDQLVKVLWEQGLEREARDRVRAAFFAHPRDGRFRALWNHFRYRELSRLLEENADEIDSPAEECRILPFIRIEGGQTRSEGGRVIRRDAAPGRRPHFPNPTQLPDRRRAQ